MHVVAKNVPFLFLFRPFCTQLPGFPFCTYRIDSIDLDYFSDSICCWSHHSSHISHIWREHYHQRRNHWCMPKLESVFRYCLLSFPESQNSIYVTNFSRAPYYAKLSYIQAWSLVFILEHPQTKLKLSQHLWALKCNFEAGKQESREARQLKIPLLETFGMSQPGSRTRISQPVLSELYFPWQGR